MDYGYTFGLSNTVILKSDFIMAKLTLDRRNQAIVMPIAGMPAFRIAQHLKSNVDPRTIPRLRVTLNTTGQV